MARHLTISEDSRRQLNDLLEVLGLSQKKLASLAGVTQPWLSHLLTGRRKKVDREMLERVADVLMTLVKSSQLPQDRDRATFDLLKQFTSASTGLETGRTYRPGEFMLSDSSHYVYRDEIERVVSPLQDMPFAIIIRGPVQCGKSSLLAELERKAEEKGVETAWFDPKLFFLPTGKQKSSINAIAAMAMYELLQAEWGLKPLPVRDGEINSISKITNWLIKELSPTAAKLRLLIMDDLASLGADAVEDWLSRFIRVMHNKRANHKINLSFGIGHAHHYGKYFERRLSFVSSIVNWSDEIDLDWFSQSDVVTLERAVGGTPSHADLYELLGGQPYLTHAAATNSPFLELVDNWTKNPSTVDPTLIREAPEYIQHLRAVRRALLGPSGKIDSEMGSLLESFRKACFGEGELDSEDRLFFETANLLDKTGKPRIPIYRLMSEDLKKSGRS